MKINGAASEQSIFTITQKKEEKKSNMSFIDTLKNQLDEVNSKQIEADKVTEAFVNGEGTDIHQVMLSAEEAEMSLQLAVQVRNKLIEAYQELSRTQV